MPYKDPKSPAAVASAVRRRKKYLGTPKGKQKHVKWQAAYQKAHPDRMRARRLRLTHKLTEQQYSQILVHQNGVCAICRRPPDSGTLLVVDHDHQCCPGDVSCGNCVRGLLCIKCNWALGHMNDDAARLRAAADYVEKNARTAHQERTS